MTSDTFTLSPPATPAGNTAAAGDNELVTAAANRRNVAAWDKIIDDYLVEWGRDPAQLAEDDLEPPTPEVIRLACAKAREWAEKGFVPPRRVVPDGEGGVSFERSDGDYFESLNIHADEVIELLAFQDCHLIERQRWS